MSLQFLPFDHKATGGQKDTSTVLVVEDDSGDEFFILRALTSMKMESNVLVVRDGQEALDYIFRSGQYEGRSETQNPKVIMLDLCIPKVAGLEVLRQIKEDPSIRHIPVVVMTSSESTFDIDRCYELGANSVVRKGRLIEEFRESIAITVAYWSRINIYSSQTSSS